MSFCSCSSRIVVSKLYVNAMPSDLRYFATFAGVGNARPDAIRPAIARILIVRIVTQAKPQRSDSSWLAERRDSLADAQDFHSISQVTPCPEEDMTAARWLICKTCSFSQQVMNLVSIISHAKMPIRFRQCQQVLGNSALGKDSVSP